ncbi:TRAP transporter small permease subunit [Desulfosarcina sp. OttesenSCG-928-A07]|nr:TRAP transporter small permease subunit [Desulfosarcina sp. OttesenSCG-928-G17]MDL2328970.1 TRAP transporter small permease subunit [Desulfosarcina sp. OttesenSCG-928-A07]
MNQNDAMDFPSLRKMCKGIDRVTHTTGILCSYVICFMVLTMAFEVLSRYLFNAPTVWSSELNQYGLCIITMMGGAYAIFHEEHVRVDIFYHRFSQKKRAAIDMVTWWLVVVFCMVLIWKGGETAVEAFRKGEKSMGFLGIPLYPTLALVPVGAFLMLIQSIARIIRSMITLKTGQNENKLAISTLTKTEN